MNNLFHIFSKKRVLAWRQELKEMQPVVVMARGHSGTRVLAQVLNLLNIQMWSDQQRQSGDTDKKLSKTIKQIVKKKGYFHHSRRTISCFIPHYVRKGSL